MKRTTDVLIVEDDQWLAEQFQRTLSLAGYTTDTISSGHVAMEMIDNTPPRVILLDVLLTGGTGVTLLHELQSYEDTAKIPVVLCTNLASQISLKEVSSYGVKRILDKTSMHPEDVVAAVRSVTI